MSAATLTASPMMKRHMSRPDSARQSLLSSIGTFIYSDCATASGSNFYNCAASEWNAQVSSTPFIDAKAVSVFMLSNNIPLPKPTPPITTSMTLSPTGPTRTKISSDVQTPSPTTAMPTESGTTDGTSQLPTSITSESTSGAPASATTYSEMSKSAVPGSTSDSSVPTGMNGTSMNAPSSSDPTPTSTSPSLSLKLSPATTSIVRDHSSSTSNHTGEIVGSVVGGLALFTLLGAITVYLRIRGRRRRAQRLAPSAEFLKIARERSRTPAGVMMNDGETDGDRSEPGTLTSRDFIALGRESPIADEELPPFTAGGYRDPVFEKIQASEEMRQWH